MTIDLNADVGEGADDLPIFPLVTSISIACGAHAGDESTMRRCVDEAKRLGIAVGAHPGYPDREGFGRRVIPMSEGDLHDSLVEQIVALRRVCEKTGVTLAHVKPHGALYNEAADDVALAYVVAAAVRDAGDDLIVVGLAGSHLVEAAHEAGLTAAAEAFADRRYNVDGSLAPRSLDGALIEDPQAAAEQAVAIATDRPITTLAGRQLFVEAETMCVHSDTPGAFAIAQAVRDALERAGVRVAPLAAR